MSDNNKPTYEQLMARLAEMEANKRKGNTLSMKCGVKGGVSIYGTGRFPTTHYPETWIKVLSFTTGLSVADLKGTPLVQFIVANQATLSFKNGIPELGIAAPVKAGE